MGYKSSFYNFLDNSNEKKLEISLLKKLLKKQRFASLLDIGAGNGEISNSIKKHFKTVDLIEKNGHFKASLSNLNCNLYYSSFEDVNLNKKYDLILACHILPYLRNNNFYVSMNKILELLNDEGLFVSFDMTTEGHLGIIKESIFNRKIKTTYEYVIEYFKENNIKFEEKKFEVKLESTTHEEMFEILKFFAEKYKDKFMLNSEYVNKYINKHLYDKRTSRFKLSFANMMVIARKK